MTKWITLPGLIEYKDAIALMEKKLHDVIEATSEESVFLLEHDHVYTAGTSYKDVELIDNKKIPVVYTGRGGKFTYHGPGQRVIYPIINLSLQGRSKDIKLYVRNLENWIIATLNHFGIKCYTKANLVGIWTNDNDSQPAKIAAIGIRVRKWVTYHGIAVNINNDLDMYSGIIPCGIKEFPVTSMNALGIKINLNQFDQALKEEYKKFF